MTSTQDSTEILLNKIQNKRAEIDSFLATKEPRNRRLTNIANLWRHRLGAHCWPGAGRQYIYRFNF